MHLSWADAIVLIVAIVCVTALASAWINRKKPPQ